MCPAATRTAKSATFGAKNYLTGPSSGRRTRFSRVRAGCSWSFPASLTHLAVVDEQDLQIMTGPQVAELLQVPPRTLEEWRQTGTGPPWRRVGKHVRYLRTEVLAWFEGLDSYA